MFGGRSVNIYGIVWKLNTKYFKWEKLKDLDIPRYGHTSLNYDD